MDEGWVNMAQDTIHDSKCVKKYKEQEILFSSLINKTNTAER